MHFELGQVVITATAHEVLNEREVQYALTKYVNCDWGLTKGSDARMNNQAIETNDDRIVARYRDSHGIEFYIITEWDRSYTTILLTGDY